MPSGGNADPVRVGPIGCLRAQFSDERPAGRLRAPPGCPDQTQDRQVQQRLTGGDQACDSGGGVMSPQPTVAKMVMVKYNASDRVSGSPNELGSCASRRIDSRDLSRRHRPTFNRRAVVPLAHS